MFAEYNYDNFNDSNQKQLHDEFNDICDFRTNVRVVKIRGIYDTQR